VRSYKERSGWDRLGEGNSFVRKTPRSSGPKKKREALVFKRGIPLIKRGSPKTQIREKRNPELHITEIQ